MKRPAVFFDRDNTLIACDEYLGDASKVVLIDGAADAVARARRMGYATVTVSNQSGVARGYFNETAVHQVNARMDELLRDGNSKAVIDRHEFCPFHPDASIEKYRQDSPLRKPAPGMLLAAAEALGLDLPRSWMIGDAPRDIEAGHATGCRTILFNDPTLKSSPAALAAMRIEPDYICSTLKEAMDFIEQNTEVDEEEEEQQLAPSSQVGEGGGKGKNVTTSTSEDSQTDSPPAPESTMNESTPTESKALAPHPSPLSHGEREQGRSNGKLESLAAEILRELRHRREHPVADFSVSKLLAGVVQVITLAILFLAFLNRADERGLMPLLLFALTLQTMTVALLIMGKQR